MAICYAEVEGRLIDVEYHIIDQGKGRRCSHCGEVKPKIEIYSPAMDVERQVSFPIGRKRRKELIPQVIEDWDNSLGPFEEEPRQWEVCSFCGSAKFIGEPDDLTSDPDDNDLDPREELIKASLENRPPDYLI